MKTQSRAVAAWDECAYKYHSEAELRLMLLTESIRNGRSVPVEKNIGFTTMGVK